jgi:hypothetical protein
MIDTHVSEVKSQPILSITVPKKIESPSTGKVMLISRNKYPVRIKYDGSTFILAPQGKAEGLDPSKIESKLPTGVFQRNL